MIKTGDHVQITIDGRKVNGFCLLASANGKSLMLTFDALLGGYAGMMPVLLHDDGHFRDLAEGRIVEVEKIILNWEENPELYEVAKGTCHHFGLPWTDPRTGETFPAPKKKWEK